MTFRPALTTLLLVATALLIAAPSAMAAAGDKALADWRDDGVINGTYSLSELRAADARVSPTEREYFGWDAAYQDAIRRLNNPGEKPAPPPPVKPVDSNGNGTIDPSEKATAVKETKDRVKKYHKALGAAATPDVRPSKDKKKSAAAASGDDDDNGGSSWLLALLVIIPAAIIALGVWRMQRARKRNPDPDGRDFS
jgi:hypothetical protein